MLNILDFGATRNDGTDDTEAIQSALDAAKEGDTVYIPPGFFHVAAADPTKTSVAALTIDRNKHPNDLTIAGHGVGSQLKLLGDHEQNHILFRVRVRDGWTGLTFRDLKLDGRKSHQSANDGGLGLWFGDANSGHQNDILVERCWFVDANQTNISIRGVNGVTVNHCTSKRAGSDHGLGYHGREDSERRGVVRNSYFANNGIYGIDASEGHLLVEDCVLENNGWGSKTTFDAIETTYRRVRFPNNRNYGYQRNPVSESGPRTKVTFDNCIADGNGNAGFRFGNETDYKVSTLVAVGNNTAETGTGNIEIRDNATVEASEIRSFGANSGFGVYIVDSATADVRTYRHFGNPSGGLGGYTRSMAVEFELKGAQSLSTPTTDSNQPQGTSVERIPIGDLLLEQLNVLEVPKTDEVGVATANQ